MRGIGGFWAGGVLWSWFLVGTFAVAWAQTTDDVVTSMIEAHGGYERWASAPAVSFTEKWAIPGVPEMPATRVVVEQGKRRAYHTIPGTDMSMGWDGERAWGMNWKVPMPPRFTALLNYYFTNLPWLVRDPGVVLGEVESAELRGEAVHAIMMTFEAGTGDTPDDYYLLYVDPKSRRLRGCEYIVTYAALLPEGVERTAPHELVFDGFTKVNGLQVPTGFIVYENGELYAKCTFTDWSFTEPFDPTRMVPPEGAVLDATKPRR